MYLLGNNACYEFRKLCLHMTWNFNSVFKWGRLTQLHGKKKGGKTFFGGLLSKLYLIKCTHNLPQNNFSAASTLWLPKRIIEGNLESTSACAGTFIWMGPVLMSQREADSKPLLEGLLTELHQILCTNNVELRENFSGGKPL